MKKTKSKNGRQLKLVNFKASARERRALARQANKYTGGVVSEYIRVATVYPERLRALKKAA